MRKFVIAALLAATASVPSLVMAQDKTDNNAEAVRERLGGRFERQMRNDPDYQVVRPEPSQRPQAQPAPQPAAPQVADRGDWGRRGGGDGNNGGGWRGRGNGGGGVMTPAPQPQPDQGRNWGGGERRGEGRTWGGDLRAEGRTWDGGRRDENRGGGDHDGWRQRNGVPQASNMPTRPDYGRDRDWGRDGNRDWNRDRNRSDNSARRGWEPNHRGNGGYIGRDDRHRNDGWRNDGWRDNDRHGGNQRGWDRGWRKDKRYDWYSYRNRYNNYYRMPRYSNPYGYGYGYNRWGIGSYLDGLLFSSRFWLRDPSYYRLPTPPFGYRWVRYYDDVLLVDMRSGYVVDVIYDFFW